MKTRRLFSKVCCIVILSVLPIATFASNDEIIELIIGGIKYHNTIVKSGMGNIHWSSRSYPASGKKTPIRNIDILLAFEGNKIRCETTEKNCRRINKFGKELKFSTIEKIAYDEQKMTLMWITMPDDGNMKHMRTRGSISHSLEGFGHMVNSYNPKTWGLDYHFSELGRALFEDKTAKMKPLGFKMINREVIDGEKCYLVMWGDNRNYEKIWINPKKCFNIQRYEWRQDWVEEDGTRVNDLIVVSNKLREYLPGIWLPASRKRQIFVVNPETGKLELGYEMSWTASKDYKLNIDVPDGLFVIEFPPGLEVRDARLDETFIWSKGSVIP